jgi:tetratricopeptide (TPR) repeat protein
VAYLPLLADCERALGRPERALEIARSAEASQLGQAEAVELRIVAAGARRDLGQFEAALLELQGPELESAGEQEWQARLRYAYADNLLAAGRIREAIRWFVAAAEADVEGATDAAERAIELGEHPQPPP